MRGVLDRVVPPALTDQGIDAARRARLTVAFSFVLSAVAFLGVAVTIALEGWGALDREAAVFTGGLVLLSIPYVLRRTESLVLSANLMIMVVFAATILITLSSGALGRPSLSILALGPMIAVMLIGVRWGIFWALLGLGHTTLLYRLTTAGFLFPNPPPPAVEAETNALVGGLIFLLALGLAITYEALKNHAIGSLEDANEQLRAFYAASEQSARELERARDAAEAAGRARAAFLASMSHEIRTPLNAVIGMTSLLVDSPLSATQRDSIETIRTSGESLLAVINDILDLSKIESGKLAIDEQPFDPVDQIHKCVGILRMTATHKGLDIRTEIADGFPRVVLGDAMRLRQILLNLLSNAVKFTENGEIIISADHRALSDDGSEIHIAVRDTGIGISESEKMRLFQAFSQVDVSTSRKYGGTGLGLVISRRLAELMKGSMWVESDVGRGSQFHFTLQVAPATAEADSASRDSPNAGVPLPANLRLLLVDDNAINRKVALKMLERLGLAADVATDGAEACRAAAKTSYDVILMDVQMPVMDGLEATRAIRATHESRPRPWVIALTANACEDDRRECLDAGMEDFVRKPFTIAELTEALRRAVKAHPPTVEDRAAS